MLKQIAITGMLTCAFFTALALHEYGTIIFSDPVFYWTAVVCFGFAAAGILVCADFGLISWEPPKKEEKPPEKNQ